MNPDARKTVLVIPLLILLMPLFADASLSRNLKLGDSGPDVKELQQFLNRDPDTAVARSGPGSPGNETEYFGALTQSAVKRFQQKYASEILTPIGLIAGTGFVGPQTRSFLAKLSGIGVIPPPILPAPSGSRPVMASVSPMIITKNPEELVITGSGFTPSGNTVITSTDPEKTYSALISNDGRTIRFTYQFRAATLLKEQADATGTSSARLLAAIVQNIRDPITHTRTTKVPLVLTIRNASGESSAIHLLIDMSKILLGE